MIDVTLKSALSVTGNVYLVTVKNNGSCTKKSNAGGERA